VPAATVAVVVEVGAKKAFASALDWPGWSRSGKDEHLALERLDEYAQRYRPVAERAGVRFPRSFQVTVVERLPGGSGTEFGVPEVVAVADHRPLSAGEATRQAALLAAAWATLDEVVARAPASLRKGPRGGGRDRDAVRDHVLEAERAYAGKLGWPKPPKLPWDAAAVVAHREACLDLLRATRSGEPPREKAWPVRYGVRRFAWHVLDHAWEIEDRSEA
jgi:hypothetical protein